MGGNECVVEVNAEASLLGGIATKGKDEGYRGVNRTLSNSTMLVAGSCDSSPDSPMPFDFLGKRVAFILNPLDGFGSL